MADAKVAEKKELPKVGIEFHKEQKIILPEGMTHDECMEAVRRNRDEEAVEVGVSEIINAFPLDGAVAFQKALQRKYGWTNLVPTPGFWGPNPPTMVGVEVDFGKTLQTPWGTCTVPRIEGTLQTSYTESQEGMPVFRLAGKVKRRSEREVASIADDIRNIVREESIYRGKAVKINFRDNDGERRDFNPSFAPKFLDLEKHKSTHIVYSSVTEKLIQTNLLNPVMYTQKCREQKIPLKRGILLEGKYGTGKTLTAYSMANLCVLNGWTFLLLEDVRDIDLAIGFARMYEPCVLFAEDVDRVMPNGNRTPEIDRILNVIDGVESKNVEIMIVLTTNNLNSIHRGLLRPGRIDTVVPVLPPDAEAIVKLVRLYGRDKEGIPTVEGTDDELKKATRELVGSNAAFVQEAVERSKLSAIADANGTLLIKPDDLAVAVESMKTHVKMVCPEAGAPEFETEDEVIDPVQFAFHTLMEQAAFHLLHKITNPKTLEKIIIKHEKRARRGRPPFSNN